MLPNSTHVVMGTPMVTHLANSAAPSWRRIDWIEDIEVQAFCINFLAELKVFRAELIAQT